MIGKLRTRASRLKPHNASIAVAWSVCWVILLLPLGISARTTSGAVGAPPSCVMSAKDRSWLAGSLENWRVAERTILELPPAPLPTIVTADIVCSFTRAAGTDNAGAWSAKPHDKTVIMPDGKMVPLGPISFASASERPGQPSYFAMSLPSVWRAAGVKSGLGLERLMDGVMLHELMHTRQFYFATPRLAGITRRYKLVHDIGDDSLQEHFEHDSAYAAAYLRERDPLFAAAAAPNANEARRLAAIALAKLKARRAHWFSGRSAYWSEYDDVFLTMERLGQWLAYRWYVSPSGPHIVPDVALREVRRGGKYWTQDEGLALFLVVDRLVPDWQRLAFAKRPLLAAALLAKAVERPSPGRSSASAAR